MNQWELTILDFIAEHLRCAPLDFIMPKITLLGDAGIFWIALALILLIPKKTRMTGLMMGVSLLIGLLVCNIALKPLIARVRPYDVAGIAPYMCAVQHDFSFPSGHTAASFEGAVVILLQNRKWGIPACVLAALIAFSRMYLYVHYPTDILGGLVIGIGAAFAGVYIVRYGERKLREKKGLPQ